MIDRILVVDDEPAVCQIVERRLQQEGHPVITAGSAERALQEIEEGEFSLIVSDVRMKRMDGISLIRELKERIPDTEVIFLTAVAEVEVAVAALKLGAYDFITKPFNLEELTVKVEGALQRRRLILENREFRDMSRERACQGGRRPGERGALPDTSGGGRTPAEALLTVDLLATAISHEVNNPLGAILGFADLLFESGGDRGDAVKYAELISREGGKILRLTNHLKDLGTSRKIHRRPEDLSHLVGRSLGAARQLVEPFPRVKLVKELSPRELACSVDRDQIRQVLLHLVLNAAQAMPEGGSVTVRTFPEARDELGPGATLTVSDTGEGVSRELRERVFEPFFTTRSGGVGLGLKICRDVVDTHQGALELVEGLDRGATFRVWLPGVSSETAPEPELQTRESMRA